MASHGLMEELMHFRVTTMNLHLKLQHHTEQLFYTVLLPEMMSWLKKEPIFMPQHLHLIGNIGITSMVIKIEVGMMITLNQVITL